MLIGNLKYFINNCDFEMLSEWLAIAKPAEVLLNPYVLIPIIVVLGLLISPKTTELGQKLIMYIPAVGYLFVTGVVLRNDVVSNTGPFIMGIIAFFIITGWLIYTNFIAS